MRVLLGTIDAQFHDIANMNDEGRAAILDPTSYTASTLAFTLSADNSSGVVYPSVRAPLGHCLAAFWPDIVGIPIKERHLQYEWNGERVTRYFDYSREVWIAI